jgi:hypothetical protein
MSFMFDFVSSVHPVPAMRDGDDLLNFSALVQPTSAYKVISEWLTFCTFSAVFFVACSVTPTNMQTSEFLVCCSMPREVMNNSSN